MKFDSERTLASLEFADKLLNNPSIYSELEVYLRINTYVYPEMIFFIVNQIYFFYRDIIIIPNK